MLWLMADSDDTRRWNAQLLCRLKHEQGTAPSYLYFFNWQSPVHNNRMGSYHTLDIPFVFYNMDIGASMTGSRAVALRARPRHERRVGRVRAHRQSQSRRHAELAGVRAEQLADDGVRRERGRRQRPEQGRTAGACGAARQAAVVTCAPNVHWLVSFAAAAVVAAAAHVGDAQNRQNGGTVEEQFVLPVPTVEKPPRDFKTAEEHYNFLLERAHGGTKHTMQTIPVWDGLWGSGNNTMPAIFLENGTLANAWRPGATKIKEGVLTPPYEQHFRERRAEIDQYGEQRYDRLTNCEYPGVPRWLWEPYIKEFVNMPHQSWLMNDMMNETRRVYIGKEHVNTESKHSPLGDSIGFWDGDKLTIWTKWVNPADYVRGMPLTSNQFEMVETWQERRGPATSASSSRRSRSTIRSGS